MVNVLRGLVGLCGSLAVLAWLVTPAGQAQPKEAAPATIKLKVPLVDAEVTIDGKATESRGKSREYETKNLEPGKEYTIEVSVKWVPNNYTEIVRTRKLKVKAGDKVSEDFTVLKDEAEEKIKVRFVPTPVELIDEMLKMAKATPKDYIADLGCGDGIMIIRALTTGKGEKGYGCDIDPIRIKECKENAAKKGVADKIKFEVRDILELNADDLKDIDIVLLYMGDDLGRRISPNLQKHMKKGARIVSHRFRLGDWQPLESKEFTFKIDGFESSFDAHLWIVGETKGETKDKSKE